MNRYGKNRRRRRSGGRGKDKDMKQREIKIEEDNWEVGSRATENASVRGRYGYSKKVKDRNKKIKRKQLR